MTGLAVNAIGLEAPPRTGGRQASVARGRLDGLQAGRAMAALMVTLFHANNYVLPSAFYGDGRSAWQGFSMGYAGVEYFFVLSGFVMFFVHGSDFGRPDAAARFLKKRVLRIYPLYWLVLSALLVLYLVVAPNLGPASARVPAEVLKAYSLWPVESEPVMTVAWTLSFEMLFYLLFVMLILDRRIGVAAFGLWMAACLGALPFAPLEWPLRFLLSPYNLLFLLGMCAGMAWSRLNPAGARVAVIVGALMFFGAGFSEAFGYVQWHEGIRTLTYGTGATFVVAGLAAGALPVPKSVVLLGDASYSLYLVHLPAMSLVVKLAVPLGLASSVPPMAAIAALCLAAVVAAILVHLIIERPLLAMASRLAGQPRRR